jgi:hypothetical protein
MCLSERAESRQSDEMWKLSFNYGAQEVFLVITFNVYSVIIM